MNPASENNELSGPTRRAVDQVRSEPVPVESMNRTLGRLRRQHPRSYQKWLRYGVLAAAASIALALMTLGTLQPTRSTEKVLFWVPKTTIKPGHKITKFDQEFVRRAFDRDDVAQKDWIADPKDLKDVTVSKELPANLPVTKWALQSNEPALALLPKGMRAVAIGCSNVAGSGGFILPGNRVDLICTLPNSKGRLSKIFLLDVLVLAVNDQDDKPAEKKTMAPGTVTFALSPADAERLTWVSTAASINLLLRRPDDNSAPKTNGATSAWGEERDAADAAAQAGARVLNGDPFNTPGRKQFQDAPGQERRLEEEARGGLPEPTRTLIVRGGSRLGKDGDKTKPSDDKPQPQVWRRDGQAPSVARVYVGDGNSLELVSLYVTTTIEGPRARTVVDHVFRNPHNRQLEGTFEYPLPTGASPSYFAMFLGQTRDTIPQRFAGRAGLPPLPDHRLAALTPDQLVKNVSQSDWGKLQEARIVGKQKALETYEEVVRGRIDPALLEYAGGNTFRGRVFPIPASGYNRVVLAYEELLPVSQGKALYRFPLPDNNLQELRLTLRARAAECRDAAMTPKGASLDRDGELLFTKTWEKKGPGGEAVFSFTPTDSRIQTVCGRDDDGHAFVYARVRPELPVRAGQTFAKHAAFLLDTSLSEHPDRFNINMKLLRKILESDADIERFNILAFNVGAAWVEPNGWLPNTKKGRETAFGRLDGLVLEGATDLGAALNKLAKPGFDVAPALPVNVFLLSDGQITWGEPDVAALTARFEANCPFRTQFHCYRTGLGADNQELFTALTRKGGGVFQCLAEADLTATAVAHKHQCLQVDKVHFVGGPAVCDVLVAGRQAAVHPGGELVVVGQAAAAGPAAALGKTTLVVEGTFQGEKFVEEYPVNLTPAGELAPRGWAEVAVASLLSLNDPSLDPLVTAYCQQFGVGSRVASFLVLENEADFQRLNLEAERGKKLPGDVGAFLDLAWKSLGKVASAKDEFQRFLAQIDPRVKLLDGAEGEHVKKLLALLQAADYELPEATLTGVLLHTTDVPADYLKARDADRRNPEAYLTEAQRRSAAGDGDGAVRVLSSIVEENPERGDALRLVGYRLLDLEQAAQASRLFGRVQRQRPFEPHSYLDLARSLEQSGKYGLAAIQYEIVLAGTWHQRFHASLKDVAREDYGRMMRQAIRAKAVVGELADHFGDRLEKMDPKKLQADLRVSMSWNTDGTDVDLWVIEPSGEKCFYSHNRTTLGGELSDDMTQGYGPERYQIRKAAAGEYTIVAHYFRPNANLLGGETHVNVVITRHAGTPQETVERKTVVLKKHNDQVEVTKVKF